MDGHYHLLRGNFSTNLQLTNHLHNCIVHRMKLLVISIHSIKLFVGYVSTLLAKMMQFNQCSHFSNFGLFAKIPKFSKYGFKISMSICFLILCLAKQYLGWHLTSNLTQLITATLLAPFHPWDNLWSPSVLSI